MESRDGVEVRTETEKGGRTALLTSEASLDRVW
jgi:hypothetical protein